MSFVLRDCNGLSDTHARLLKRLLKIVFTLVKLVDKYKVLSTSECGNDRTLWKAITIVKAVVVVLPLDDVKCICK